MKELQYSLKWDGDKVLVEAEDQHGKMVKLYYGPPKEAHIALTAWKTAVNTCGAVHWSIVTNFDWNQI